ncbi:MAG TPA: xanthine dehydrogenase family protein subunit M [Acidobacteriota bacterium]|nr:xanthine dehydrogenase family protein subunit M [Acidobacteriota bacterium]
MMKAFEYASPTTREQAVKALSSADNAVILAGGTDLLSLMKDRIITPGRVVNIKNIQQLKGIRSEGGGLRIGSLVTLDELLNDDNVKKNYPALIQAADGVRSPQIQMMGTVGGDLCQRPRCWYYRSGYGLLAQHNGRSMVEEGDNRYHAILGNQGPAYFVNPSSLAPALIALEARLKIFGPKGEREVALEDFYRIPSRNDEREYDLASDEILTEIIIPASGARNATYEVRQKEALDWPLAAAGVTLRMNGNQVEDARVVLGHVAPTPWISTEAREVLVGNQVSEELADRAGRQAVANARALSRNEYKIRLAHVAVKRAVLRATGREI